MGAGRGGGLGGSGNHFSVLGSWHGGGMPGGRGEMEREMETGSGNHFVML